MAKYKRRRRYSGPDITGHVDLNPGDQFQTTLSANYRGPQFAEEDNSDNTSGVYGASDEYLLLNVKSQYKQPIGHDMTVTMSVGVDNLLNENYYDFHPYPQRSYFASIALDI